MLKKIIQISKEVYLHMGGLNFDEKDFEHTVNKLVNFLNEK